MSKEYTEDEERMFSYLNTLRESGETNMFGAGPYLREKFGIDKRESNRVLKLWREKLIDEA